MKQIFIILATMLPLILSAYEYDTYYYDMNGNKQYLKQIYSMAAAGERNLNVINIASVKTKAQWINYRNQMVKKNISVWPVVTYHAVSPLILNGKLGIVFKKDTSESEKNEILKKFSLVLNARSDYYPYEYFETSLRSGTDPFETANRIFETGKVLWAQPNWLQSFTQNATAPDDKYYDKEWQITQSGTNIAWDTTKGSADIKIAIVDSGIDITHPDLLPNIIAGRNFADETASGDPSPDKNVSGKVQEKLAAHGTNVAGIAAAAGNNFAGIAGACWNCKIMPVKYMSNSDTAIAADRIMNAMKWAVDNGAAVINNSWGDQDTDASGGCVTVPLSNFREQAIMYAKDNGRAKLGALIVWAAGNSNCDTRLNQNLQNNNIIVVSALTENGVKAEYSNYGDAVDIAAGAGNFTTDITGTGGLNSGGATGPQDAPDYTDGFAGTSSSAPLVSGIIALMLSVNPKITFEQSIKCIKLSAAELDTECTLGAPKILADNDPYSPPNKPHSPCYGYGMIDAEKLITMAGNGLCSGFDNGCEDGKCGEGYYCNKETRRCEDEKNLIPDADTTADKNSGGCSMTIFVNR